MIAVYRRFAKHAICVEILDTFLVIGTLHLIVSVLLTDLTQVRKRCVWWFAITVARPAISLGIVPNWVISAENQIMRVRIVSE